ncbi:NB-ARC domain-containing protein [Mycena venus]|uniref:Tetratricopeptide repeat protein 29 n=1 Tax=Mycena venus TaxID=2733690 RepID=A0A8H7CQR8_9AGAR|nr:NB-ARC domain-containing protein [Mycena venus]
MPLDHAAAHQTFIEIADEIHDSSEVNQLLDITDNIPLAIQLVAGIAASIGCQDTIECWNTERTSLFSAGYDKQSNLEISIMLSLLSPHMQSSPHAAELLSLMSLLSVGISDLDLVQSNIPIQDIPDCKTTLLCTSLAYVDRAGRFKVLAPIREYIHVARPPSWQLVRPLQKYLVDLLKLYNAQQHASPVIDLVPRLVSNLGNLHNLLLHGLDSDHTDLRESILGIIMLNNLSTGMNRGLSPLMLCLPEILSGMDDHELHRRFITAAFESSNLYTLPDPELAIHKAMEHTHLMKDHDGETQLYQAIAQYYFEAGDTKKAEEFYQLALSVALQCNNDMAKARPLAGLGWVEWLHGNYSGALQLGQEIYRIGRAAGNVRGVLDGIRLQASCFVSLGHFNHAMQLLEDGKELIVQAGLQGGSTESLLMNIEATVYHVKTEYSHARRIQEAILHQTSATLSPMYHAYALASIALLDIVTSATADIVSHNLDAATAGFQNAQYPRGDSLCEYGHAELLLREGEIMAARAKYMQLFAAARNNDDEIACNCLMRLADPTNPVHADIECGRWAVVFLAYALNSQLRSRLMVHQALRRLGDVFMVQGAENTALSILSVALEGFTQMDVHQSRAECMHTIGKVYVQCGDIGRAREMWEAAWPLFERSEQRKEVAKIEEKLQMLSLAQKLNDISQVELSNSQAALQISGADSEKTKPGLIPDL